ncbi:MAG: NAD(P)-dependent oxidoreductase [Desulfovibrio sp.]|jgi:nucleoside-diphosphate-sugar epimerase|nr:NAD(P)-dependent oxidoreductase [Desulfovibrio sp.]
MLKTAAASRARRCLITGGTGYAGSWISRHLALRGHEAVAVSRSGWKTAPGFPCACVTADLEKESPQSLTRLFADKTDLVVHAAALTDATLPDYPRRSLLTNALGTRNILESLRLRYKDAPEEAPLLIYCSTVHVYGRSEGKISERTPPAPGNDYALTHLFAEEYCRMFARLHGLRCIILRFCNGYGAPAFAGGANWSLLLNDLCKGAVSGTLLLRSDPRTPRDFLWLGDFAAVIEALMPRKDLAGRVFNVSYGKSLSIGEVARRVVKIASGTSGRKIKIQSGHGGTRGRAKTLSVSNRALLSETGLLFTDHLDEEIEAILLQLE